ncbi:MAG: hydroxymethylglutaryl-CoA lyase [Candidatus Zixiibacteriota bacterium]
MIRIVEVGPRDGLQNEFTTLPTSTKVALIDALSETGVAEIEASAFVAPKWVPQLADATEVFAAISRRPGVIYSALVPNEEGLDRALEARADRIAVFTAASETFNRKNINAGIEESFERFEPVMKRAAAAKIPVRGYVSTAFWCPYQGPVAPEAVVPVARRLLEMGVYEVSIGDTIGKATTDEVRRVLDLLLPIIPASKLAMHFHDTYRHASDNVRVSYEMGIRAFDSSIGGLGGCPYAPSASGNIPTETLVATLMKLGADPGIDSNALDRARNLAAKALGRSLPPTA